MRKNMSEGTVVKVVLVMNLPTNKTSKSPMGKKNMEDVIKFVMGDVTPASIDQEVNGLLGEK